MNLAKLLYRAWTETEEPTILIIQLLTVLWILKHLWFTLTNLGSITCENEFSHLILVSGKYFNTFYQPMYEIEKILISFRNARFIAHMTMCCEIKCITINCHLDLMKIMFRNFYITLWLIWDILNCCLFRISGQSNYFGISGKYI